MCGIAGLIDPNLAPEARAAVVGRMCDAMVHRGPDDAGLESPGDATLGMRRLAIFDPAHGHQPMVSPDGRHTLVFNGAIYNFRELRRDLADGWTFRTECDTEVLLAAFVRWGEACLGRLRGMFAFAVWDARERSLFVARDPFGIKPLYYRQDGARFCFASELNALRAGGFAAQEIDPVAISDYLAWFAVPAPRTIYRHTRSLRPGECATFTAGRLAVRRAWSFARIPPADKVCASPEEFRRELRARLEDTIRAHVVADVPVGAFLSGGLDSAGVCALMTQATGGPLRTFSIGFEESEFSEADAAAASARHFGAEHHAMVLTGGRVAAELERFLGACDQPTGDALNTYFVSEAARQGGVTVALSGLGGDELFGGYPSFRTLPRLARWLPWWRRLPMPLRRTIVRRLRRGDTRQRKLADLLAYGRNLNQLASLQRRVFSEHRRRALLGPLLEERDASPYHPELEMMGEDLAGAPLPDVASAWELRTYMADLLLRDSDAMSMRHSLELRVPFVDRPLIEWLWRQPPEFRFTPDQPKSALAAAVADLLPPDLQARRKQGFSLPMAAWMRGPLRPFLDETFSDASVERSGLLARGPAQASWRTFLESSDTRHWSRVWSVAVLLAFVNRRTARPAERPAPISLGERDAPPPPAPRSPTGGTLLLVPEIFSATGGIQRILQLYLRALCARAQNGGPRVRLLALNDAMLDSGDLRRAGAENLSDWSVCNRDKKRFVKDAVRLAKGCDRLICGHVAQLPAAWAARRMNRRLRYSLVAHGIEVWRNFSMAERLALRGVDRVFCVSAHTRREFLRYAPVNPERVVVLPNGLDPAFPIGPGQPLAECPPVILAVGRLSPEDRYKGIEALIEAMPLVRDSEPQARLRIVGHGDDLARLQALARRLELPGSAVEFLGFVPDAQLAREFASCRLFALPSPNEGFGLVYLEAMANGRPCLGVAAGAAPEVITPEAGLVVAPGDRRALAAGLLDGLRRPWNEAAILDRARSFSYPVFQRNLADLIT